MANNSFTYQELENQIVELKRQNEILDCLQNYFVKNVLLVCQF